MGKQYIVKGAMAQCNQSKVPMIAQLNLITDNMFVYMNGNPVATTMTIGPVFGPAPFGICNMIPPTPAVPTPPCVCAVLSWSGADTAVKINMISNPLTTDSKGTCALGGSISFKMSGQFPKPSIPPIPMPAVGDMNMAATDKKVGKNSPMDDAITDLRTKAKDVSEDVQRIAEGIAGKYNASVTPINLKSTESIKRKAKSESLSPEEISTGIKDSVRTTIVTDKEKIPAIIEDLKADENFLRYKEQTPDKFMGYSGHIINLRMGNGVIAEIQVNTPKMIYAKEKEEDAKRILGEDVWNGIREETGMEGGRGHSLYEDIRIINPNKDEASRKRKEELEQKSREYYSHFNK